MNRALLIGINAYPGDAALRKCVSDAMAARTFLLLRAGFKVPDVWLLTDADATTEAVNRALDWLLHNLVEGDRWFLLWSGHGAVMTHEDGATEECLCPVDFDWSAMRAILATSLRERFARIPGGVAGTACHRMRRCERDGRSPWKSEAQVGPNTQASDPAASRRSVSLSSDQTGAWMLGAADRVGSVILGKPGASQRGSNPSRIRSFQSSRCGPDKGVPGRRRHQRAGDAVRGVQCRPARASARTPRRAQRRRKTGQSWRVSAREDR